MLAKTSFVVKMIDGLSCENLLFDARADEARQAQGFWCGDGFSPTMNVQLHEELQTWAGMLVS